MPPESYFFPSFAGDFAGPSTRTACTLTDASATDAQVESTLPPITLSLPSATSGLADVTIQGSPLDKYIQNNGGGQYCLVIADDQGGGATFGDAFMQAFLTVVDVQNGRVGFAPTGCKTPAVRRLHHSAENGPRRRRRLGH